MVFVWFGLSLLPNRHVSFCQVLHLALNPEVDARRKLAKDSLEAEVEELRAKVGYFAMDPSLRLRCGLRCGLSCRFEISQL